MNSQSEHLVLFSECIPIKGYVRTALYDLSRIDFIFIPNELREILINNQGCKKSKIFNNYSCFEKEYLEQCFSYLDEHDFIFFCDQDEVQLFPPLDLEWDYPAIISNIYIEEIPANNNLKNKVLEIFELLNTKDFVLRLDTKIDLPQLLSFCDRFTYTKVKCIDLFINEKNNQKIKNDFHEILSKNHRIRTLVVYNASQDYSNEGRFGFGNVYFKKENFSKKTIIEQKFYFTINITLFTESQAHHTYFNRKLYIGPNGEIKNAPECEETFGYIQDLESPEQLKEIVQTPAFQKYWYVHKEITDICKDCEFRHMCVDNRLPYQRSENEWYHKTECNYNPYIAKWKGEEGYRTLAECGVISNHEGFTIDHEKIAAINEELWGEE